MFAELSSHPTPDSLGCAVHNQVDCLCDVTPLALGVPIVTVPFAERLMELGLNRVSFTVWADEVAAWQDSQATGLHLAAEAN
jgi:hypothetical protein